MVLPSSLTASERKVNKENFNETTIGVFKDNCDGRSLCTAADTASLSAAFAGSVKIVDGDRISFLEANLGDVSRALSHWGVGVRELLANNEK